MTKLIVKTFFNQKIVYICIARLNYIWLKTSGVIAAGFFCTKNANCFYTIGIPYIIMSLFKQTLSSTLWID